MGRRARRNNKIKGERPAESTSPVPGASLPASAASGPGAISTDAGVAGAAAGPSRVGKDAASAKGSTGTTGSAPVRKGRGRTNASQQPAQPPTAAPGSNVQAQPTREPRPHKPKLSAYLPDDVEFERLCALHAWRKFPGGNALYELLANRSTQIYRDLEYVGDGYWDVMLNILWKEAADLQPYKDEKDVVFERAKSNKLFFKFARYYKVSRWSRPPANSNLVTKPDVYNKTVANDWEAMYALRVDLGPDFVKDIYTFAYAVLVPVMVIMAKNSRAITHARRAEIKKPKIATSSNPVAQGSKGKKRALDFQPDAADHGDFEDAGWAGEGHESDEEGQDSSDLASEDSDPAFGFESEEEESDEDSELDDQEATGQPPAKRARTVLEVARREDFQNQMQNLHHSPDEDPQRANHGGFDLEELEPGEIREEDVQSELGELQAKLGREGREPGYEDLAPLLARYGRGAA